MVVQEGAVYCTLLLSDNYLPGAVVLAHSLRDNGSQAKLVALYTPDALQAATIKELQAVYDMLIPVHRTTNHTPANLWLMERPDLIATFTKIELWRQTQFKRIVYIDSDVVSIRAPDELFDLDVDFAAAPDVGWPDCFNSGVMVLRPNMQDYFALKALAERGISFDGADQGLLNIHFRNWHRLSFTYNCTPSGNYQYIPAYKHFQSTISLIHFIGFQKPWNMPRQIAPFGSQYNQLLARWWSVYDRHYRPITLEQIHQSSRSATLQYASSNLPAFDTVHAPTPPEPTLQKPTQQQLAGQPRLGLVSGHHQQELQPDTSSRPTGAPELECHMREEIANDPTHALQPADPRSASSPSSQAQLVETEDYRGEDVNDPMISVVPQYVRGEEHVRAYIQPQRDHELTSHIVQPPTAQEPSVRPGLAHPPDEVHHSHAPHQQAPPAEASYGKAPYQASEVQTAFEAPKAQWDASREAPPLNSKPEGIALKTKTYTMSEDHQLFQPPESYPEPPKNMYYQVPSTKPQPQKVAQLFPWEANPPKPTRVFADDDHQIRYNPVTNSPKEESETSRPSLTSSQNPGALTLPSESWDTYSRSNAWDEVPGIQQYIQTIQQGRKGKVQVLSGGPNQPESPPSTSTPHLGNLSVATRITDFPSETERPSLPVTPAPIHRSPAMGSPDDYTTDQLPAAEGVPNQEDWNPSVRLEELRRRQSEVSDNPGSLLERLAKALGKGAYCAD